MLINVLGATSVGSLLLLELLLELLWGQEELNQFLRQVTFERMCIKSIS